MSFARFAFAGSFLLAAPFTVLASCWPLAPSGGSISDASIVFVGNVDGSGFGDAPSTGSDSSSTGSDSSANADATSDGSTTVPYPSTTIAAGAAFGCRVDGSGGVWCWGANGFSQAGSAWTAAPVAPQQVPNLTDATAIASGDYHACAVTANGGVYCWGLNDARQLGHSPGATGANDGLCPGTGNPVFCNPNPLQVAGIPAAVAVSAAGAYTCAVGADGSAWCWGAIQTATAAADDAGTVTCGSGTAGTGGTCYAAPYAIGGLSGVTQLSVGLDHSCALTSTDAGLLCWGNDDRGQVAAAPCTTNYDCPSPVAASLSSAVTSVAVGPRFTCAIVTDGGTVSCFGENGYGELGHKPGTTGDPPVDAGGPVYNSSPLPVQGLGPVTELVASGSQAACALIANGAVECWGNVASDAGPGVPVTVAGLPPMNALGVPDTSYACGVAGDASVWCWDLGGATSPTQVQ
jgi:alpha-tubulin suppressor-like RCC1 family protein